MKNLKKSLVLITTLGGISSLYSSQAPQFDVISDRPQSSQQMRMRAEAIRRDLEGSPSASDIRLGRNGAGVQKLQAISGFRKGEAGFYNIQDRTAFIERRDKTIDRYSHVELVQQRHAGTLVGRPSDAPKKAVKFAYFDTDKNSKGGLGKPGKRTILFGVLEESESE